MNWDAIGAVGEVAGAIGVIATLVYLAQQIRASTKATRLAIESELYDGTREILRRLSSDQNLARIYRLGIVGDPSLTPDEWTQFGGFLFQLTTEWERQYFLLKRREVEDFYWFDVQRRIRREVVGSPGYRRWFEIREHWVSDEFREVLAAEVAESSGYRAMGDALSQDED